MQKRTKIIIFSIGGLLSLIILPIILIFAWNLFVFWDIDFSSQHGITEISVNGKKIFFKREARGLNYDEVILSPNNDYCAEYNPDTDFSFPGMDDVIYYKVKGEVLQLISPPTIQPKNFPVKVEVHEVKDPMEWFRLKDTHKENGIEFLDVPLNDQMKCN